METLELEEQAAEAARFRGHWLGPWVGVRTPVAKCTICGAIVRVDTSPAPNEIDISGSAVAIYCTGKDAA